MDVPNRQVAEAFVELADTAGGDFDLPTYADLVSSHSVDLLRAEAAGVLVGDSSDATAPEQLSPVLDSRALQMHEGAGFECFATGILNERSSRFSGALINQLRTALNSRVAIEQAKGVLAARHEIDINEAFTALRQYARSHNLRLLDVARTVVTSPALAVEVLTARRQR